MQKIYCSKCGNPNLYTQAKPKFCSACGTPFYGVIVEKPQDKKRSLIDRGLRRINRIKQSGRTCFWIN